jgi:hypothetical protein
MESLDITLMVIGMAMLRSIHDCIPKRDMETLRISKENLKRYPKQVSLEISCFLIFLGYFVNSRIFDNPLDIDLNLTSLFLPMMIMSISVLRRYVDSNI